eukprot:9126844-Lingulodinium_polyedra.AAC.1
MARYSALHLSSMAACCRRLSWYPAMAAFQVSERDSSRGILPRSRKPPWSVSRLSSAARSWRAVMSAWRRA